MSESVLRDALPPDIGPKKLPIPRTHPFCPNAFVSAPSSLLCCYTYYFTQTLLSKMEGAPPPHAARRLSSPCRMRAKAAVSDAWLRVVGGNEDYAISPSPSDRTLNRALPQETATWHWRDGTSVSLPPTQEKLSAGPARLACEWPVVPTGSDVGSCCADDHLQCMIT